MAEKKQLATIMDNLPTASTISAGDQLLLKSNGTMKTLDGSVVAKSEDVATLESTLSSDEVTLSAVVAESASNKSEIGEENKKITNPNPSKSVFADADTGSLVDSTTNQRSALFDVSAFGSYKASGRLGANTQMALAVYYDEDESYISSECRSQGASIVITDYELTIPENAKYVRIQGYYGIQSPLIEFSSGIKNRLQKLENAEEPNPYKGKYLSVIGASTCTYDGVIPSRNKTYYPKGDVNSVDKMWWQRVCDSLTMNRLVIEAWSGSKVSDIDAGDNYSNFVPMADTSRCQNLHTSDHNPDVIIIQGGINDFSKANDVLGTWNGGTFPATISTFRDAFATMMKNINNQYPHAMIFVIGLPQFVRTKNEMQGVESSANEHKSFADYNRAMMDMCDMFGCNYISLNGIYSRIELSDGTIADSATYGKTHPNAEGHRRWAERIVSAMKSASY